MLEELKDLMIKAGYPDLSNQNIEYFKIILSKENRLYLLIWIYKQVNNESLEFNDPNLKNILIECLQENGFCRSSESNKFLCGDKFKDNEEFRILKRICNFIIAIKEESSDWCSSDNMEIVNTLENLKLFNDDLKWKYNVLPEYIPHKKISDNEKILIHKQLEKENQELQKKIDELENQKKLIPHINIVENQETNLETIFSDFKQVFEQFQQQIQNNFEKNQSSDEKIDLDEKNYCIKDSLYFVEQFSKLLEAKEYLRNKEETSQKNNTEKKVYQESEIMNILKDTLN